jgi:hypothetical protein
VWQSLYITDQDGSSYWVNPVTPNNLAEIYGENTAANQFYEVASETNTIYMNVNASGVTAWTFSCQETITLRTTSTPSNPSGTLIGYGTQTGLSSTPSSFTVNANGKSVPQGQTVQVTSDQPISESGLQNWLDLPGSITNAGDYYFVVTLSNISLTLTVNGQTATLTNQTPTSQNVLTWFIHIQ